MSEPRGVVSDYHDEADAIARRAWKALAEGRGMRLTASEVFALHEIEGDGDWWQSFNPASPAKALPTLNEEVE